MNTGALAHLDQCHAHVDELVALARCCPPEMVNAHIGAMSGRLAYSVMIVATYRLAAAEPPGIPCSCHPDQ